MAICNVAAKLPPGLYLNSHEMAFATENETPHLAHSRAFVRICSSVFTNVSCKKGNPHLKASRAQKLELTHSRQLFKNLFLDGSLYYNNVRNLQRQPSPQCAARKYCAASLWPKA